MKTTMKYLQLALFSIFLMSQVSVASAEEKMKLYLMIGTPNSETWANMVKGEVDMSIGGRKGIETMGGKMLGFYIGVGQAKNYAIVSFPDSIDVAKIVYTRAMQGVMDDIQFIEIMSTKDAAAVFKMINQQKIGGNT